MAPNDQNHTKQSAGLSVVLPVDLLMAPTTVLEGNNKDESTEVCTNHWTVCRGDDAWTGAIDMQKS